MNKYADTTQEHNSRAAANTTRGRVVQRYATAGGHRIANDHTAAVKEGKNNKDLFATQARIDASNAIFAEKRMPISLTAGAAKGGLVDDQVLLTATPTFVATPSNKMSAEMTPRAGAQHVLLPSECELGAISIIGALTKTARSAGNQHVYEDKDHDQARIGELLSRSTAPGGTKDAWFASWVTLDAARDKAVTAHETLRFDKVAIDDMFLGLNDAVLKGEFDGDFEPSEDRARYIANYLFSPAQKAQALFKRILTAFDKKVEALEAKVMATVATGTAGQREELETAVTLKDTLANFFQNRNYDKASIDAVIQHSPQRAQLEQQIREEFAATQAGKYLSTATFYKDTKVAAFAAKVLADLDKQIGVLTARNTKSLGNGSGLNAEVNPGIGESYGIVGGQFDLGEGGRWNFHWASVILKAGADNVTMEAHRTHKQGNETHNDRWDFKMYGTAAAGGQTFHDEWKSQGFGKAPVTVKGIVRDEPQGNNFITKWGIDALTLPQTVLAKAAIHALKVFMTPLSVLGASRQELIDQYKTGVPSLANLPPKTIALMVEPFLTAIGEAIDRLEKKAGSPDDLLKDEQRIKKHSGSACGVFDAFTSVVDHYVGHKKKQGLF